MTESSTLDRARAESYPLNRRAVVARALRDRGDLLLVTGLGAPTWDAAAVGDHDLTFPLWGAMGGAALIGLGLAIARPERRVLVITGDGEFLMGLGALATIAIKRPANLAVLLLDNERYGETGMQATHTAGPVDLPAMAAAAGFAATATVRDASDLETAMPLLREAPGPTFVSAKVTAEDLPLVMPPKDGAHLKDRFRAALLGDAGGS